jgi:hypothetical protein
MRLKSISLEQDGHYTASLEKNHGGDFCLAAMSLDELHTMIHDCVTDPQHRGHADEIYEKFLETVVENAVLNLNTLRAKFGRIAA